MFLKTAVAALAVLCCLALVSCGDEGPASSEGGNSSATGAAVKIYPDPPPEERAEAESPSAASEPKDRASAEEKSGPTGKSAAAARMSAHQGTIRISAEKLYAAYGEDSEQADKVYLGKRVAVSGEIWRVVVEEKDMFGRMGVVRHPYVTFRSGSDYGAVQCFFEKSDADALRGLEPGKRITIIGECAGRKGYVQNVHISASRLAL